MAEIEERIRIRLNDLAEALVRKLNEEIEKGHDILVFIIMIYLALMKDVLDLVGAFAEFVPVAGSAADLAQSALGVFLGALLFAFLWGKGYFLRLRIRIIHMVLGIFFDNLPVFKLMPINVLMVIYAWHIVRKRARKAKKKLEEYTGSKLSRREAYKLSRDPSLLEDDDKKYDRQIYRDDAGFDRDFGEEGEGVLEPPPKTADVL